MKNFSTLFKVCFTIIIALNCTDLLAQKKVHVSKKQNDTLNLTLKVKPEDYVYPEVIDSVITYNYVLANDSIPFRKTIYYQDNELRDTAIYTFNYDTIEGVWVEDTKNEKIYNNGDNSPSQKTYEWNEVLQRWINKDWRRKVINSNRDVDARYEWNAIINEWVGQRIDSSIIEDGLSVKRFYSNGVDQNNEWIPATRQEFEYRYLKDTLETTINSFSYDSEEKLFKPSTINTSIEINGKLHSRTYQKNEDDSLVFDKMYRYEYNNKGRRTLNETYEYNHELKIWELHDFREYQYNFKGERTQITRYKWNNAANAPLPHQKTEYTNSNEGVTQSITSLWSISLDEWVPDSKTNVSYTNGNYSEFIESEWDEANLEWDIVSRKVYEYNDDGRRTLESEFESNKTETEEESEVRRFEYQYDTLDNGMTSTQFFYYRWNNTLENIAGNYGYKYIYNEQGRVTESHQFIWDTSIVNWKLGNSSYYYLSDIPEKNSSTDTIIVQDTVLLPSDTVIVNDSVFVVDTIFQDLDTINVVIYDTIKVIDTVTVTVTDTSILSSIETIHNKKQTVTLYPNPAQDLIFLENPQDKILNYEIHSLEGKRLKQGIIRGKGVRKNINISDYEPGLYIVLIYDNNDFYKQLRFVKQ